MGKWMSESLRDIDDAVRAEGIETRHQQMDNGEWRFRLLAGDGSAYIRTVAGPVGAWQNSHFHKTVLETYIVQRGWVALVEFVNGSLGWHVLRPGSVFTTSINVPHNVYMPGGAILHTVKHGSGEVDDWHAHAELDALTKPLTEDVVLTQA
jgi:hypothetical protein